MLAREIFEHLPETCELIFDGTFGHGGHMEYFLSRMSSTPRVLACDVDKKIMDKGLHFTAPWKDFITPILDSYANIDLRAEKYGLFDFVLLDLGVNLEHFKDGERGFSIKVDAPLDMRFRNDGSVSAKDIIATYPKEKLEKILTIYGDFSPKTAEYITKALIETRKKQPIETTFQLFDLLSRLHFNQKKIAVVFQVLRIETNQELLQLEIFLKKLGKVVSCGGRCSIITYHSIEDRMVKTAFKSLADD
ncbi:16S rRNA (cytosine(1402)-N(4))-methyltransferase RsmH [bacterium]|nr:16S rRNA (cytosine(1402)-N(4))-methyltransferase RsmH [bacterium]